MSNPQEGARDLSPALKSITYRLRWKALKVPLPRSAWPLGSRRNGKFGQNNATGLLPSRLGLVTRWWPVFAQSGQRPDTPQRSQWNANGFLAKPPQRRASQARCAACTRNDTTNGSTRLDHRRYGNAGAGGRHPPKKKASTSFPNA